jgi:hypothetical protein
LYFAGASGAVGGLLGLVVAARWEPLMIDQASNGYELFPREQQTPEALHAFHKANIEKWWLIIKAANIKAE